MIREKNYSFNGMKTSIFKEDFRMNDWGKDVFRTFFKIALGCKLGIEFGGFISVVVLKLTNKILDKTTMTKYPETVKKYGEDSELTHEEKNPIKSKIGFRCE